MFIEPRKPVTVDELIRGMVVQSGNDACIALAEAVAGSEEVFAQMMNREAQRLGMRETKFTNATGLPDPQHYSTARDLHLLAAALIRDFPAEYALYYTQKEYRYNNITQHNRNRLLWIDPTVDGVKTGYTEAAGYCLIASSKRGPRRLLSVLLGSTSEAARAQESQKLLNWGFQFFDAVRLYGKGQTVKEIEVWKGDRGSSGGLWRRPRHHAAKGGPTRSKPSCSHGGRSSRRWPKGSASAARQHRRQAVRRISGHRPRGGGAGGRLRPRLGYTETVAQIAGQAWFF
jgi:D-alanyl-D-alanine carboxypeptidase